MRPRRRSPRPWKRCRPSSRRCRVLHQARAGCRRGTGRRGAWPRWMRPRRRSPRPWKRCRPSSR
ncbi:hypothetical protein C7E17_26250, partial [Stenotrophomonas maltophilia]